MADETDKVTIRVDFPNKALQRAFALDLPPKVKSKVLSSIIAEGVNPGKAALRGPWGETWGETLPMEG